jgi:hypothetical protein
MPRMNRSASEPPAPFLLPFVTEPLLDLAAQLGAGDEGARLQLEDRELAQVLGDVAGRDPHRQRADDGALADARLADEKRVMLVAALEDLEQAPDLDVAADDRVELAAPRALDEIRRERRAVEARGHRDLAGDGAQRAHVRAQGPGPERELLEHPGRGAPQLLGERVQQVLDLHGARGPRLFFGAREEREHRAGQVRETRPRLAQTRQRGLRFARDVGGRCAGAADDLGDAGVPIEGSREQMNRLDLGVLSLVGERLGAGDEGLGVGSVAFEVNRLFGGHGNGCERSTRPGQPPSRGGHPSLTFCEAP